MDHGRRPNAEPRSLATRLSQDRHKAGRGRRSPGRGGQISEDDQRGRFNTWGEIECWLNSRREDRCCGRGIQVPLGKQANDAGIRGRVAVAMQSLMKPATGCQQFEDEKRHRQHPSQSSGYNRSVESQRRHVASQQNTPLFSEQVQLPVPEFVSNLLASVRVAIVVQSDGVRYCNSIVFWPSSPSPAKYPIANRRGKERTKPAWSLTA